MTTRPRDDRGAVLPLTVVSLLALIGFAALAIDLAWAYLNLERQQRAADAAALAAVVEMPPDSLTWSASTAYVTALDVADKNGYEAAEVDPQRVFSASGNLLPNRVRVDVTRQVDTFLFDIFGVDTLTLTRSATAEFLPPLQLGSDQPILGAFPNGSGCPAPPDPPTPGCIDPTDPGTWGGWNPGLWLAINGAYTAKEQGDPFTTNCLRSNSARNCISANNEHFGRNHYGVEVPSGAGRLTVDLFDPVFWGGGNGSTAQIGAGDTFWPPNGPFSTTFQLLAPDATPGNPNDNANVECTRSFAASEGPLPFDAGDPINFEPQTLCTIFDPPAGIHVLRVTVEGGIGHGTNGFSVRADTDVGTPKVYGIGRMSLHMNQPSSTPVFQLANVPPTYAGRTLTISLFDPGEASGNAYVGFKGQAENLPCSLRVRRDDGSVEGPTTPSGTFSGSRCWVQSASGAGAVYNGDWLDFTFNVPEDYDCNFEASECWWRVQYTYSDPSVHDRTTWEVDVRGTPVRLVHTP